MEPYLNCTNSLVGSHITQFQSFENARLQLELNLSMIFFIEIAQSEQGYLFSKFGKISCWQEIQKKISRALKMPNFNWKCFADSNMNFY